MIVKIDRGGRHPWTPRKGETDWIREFSSDNVIKVSIYLSDGRIIEVTPDTIVWVYQ
jgi:hypothetical protein